MEEFVNFKGVKITREAILKELSNFDALYKDTNAFNSWLDNDIYKYGLIYNGKKYPHKYILSKVSGFNTDEMLGGLQTAEVFTKLGFTVEEKNKEIKKTTWIFQGNPNRFDVDEYVKNSKQIQWALRQLNYKDKISIGDIVYIWRSDGNISGSGGIIAKSRVVSPPHLMNKIDNEYKKSVTDPEALFIDLEVDEFRLTEKEGMLKRTELEKDTRINSIRIIKARTGTNFELKQEEAQYLADLWKNGWQIKPEQETHYEATKLLLKKKQIILYGPPGTGKTYNTKKIALDLLKKGNNNA